MNSRNRLRKALSVSLVCAILLSLSMVSSFATSSYSDIPNNWSKNAIQAAITNGLLVGSNGRINPESPLTRAQMVTIVNRAFGASSEADITNFTDVSSSAWYAHDIAKAVKMEILFGYNNKINPESNITREQAFAIIARALNLSSSDYTSLNVFQDNNQISSTFKSEISALVKAGYVAGSNGMLNPKSLITRAQFAQVMYNIFKAYVKTAGTYTSVSAGSIMVNVPGVTLSNVIVSGDLILGDGVGNGDVTLDHVTVAGRTIVRGGGSNSIHVINGSSLTGALVVNNVNRTVRVVTDNSTTIPKVEAQNKAVLEGKFGDIEVKGKHSDALTFKGQANNIIVGTANAAITVSGTVGTVTTAANATGAQIIATPDAKITTVVAQAMGTTVSGPGVVNSVQAGANNVTVSTPNTSVTAGPDVTGVVVGGESAPGGSTTTTPTLTTSLTLNSVSYKGSPVVRNDFNQYVISKEVLTSSGGIEVSITGQNFYDYDYTMSVSISGAGISGGITEQAIQNVPGLLMNQTYNQSFSSFLAMIDLYNQIVNREGISEPNGVINSFMSDFDGYLSRLEPGDYDITIKASGAALLTIKLVITP